MQTNHTKQYHVFLSHSSNDKAHVERIAVRLEDEAGLKPFLDKWHLVPGEPWQEAIEIALDSSETCAVFLGSTGLGPWENEEMRSALDERVRQNSFRVIPVLLPGADPKDDQTLPRFLRRLTWVDLRIGVDEQEAFNCLVAGIRGVSPGRNHQTQKEVVQWELRLTGAIDDIQPVMKAITAHLRQLSGDVHLTIQKIERGSVRLFIESSLEGFECIKTAFEQGQLHDVMGLEVLSLKLSNHPGNLQAVSTTQKASAHHHSSITQLLLAWSRGDQVAFEELISLVYEKLHRLAHAYLKRERSDSVLQTTALVNEAFIRLLDSKDTRWRDRGHFFAILANTMRRVLLDYARGQSHLKRGGEAVQISLEAADMGAAETSVELLALDAALHKLAAFDQRKSLVVELRYFGGLNFAEMARALDVSEHTAKREWQIARMWLRRELEGHI